MNLWVNGERAEVAGLTTVAELADHYGLQPNSVLIEHNQTALHQREWPERKVTEGDRIEFIRVVAGG
ncbi:MAG TPA: sulfur carrier protein ThiS [Chthoniobacterales bacterium]|jgi:sulfur carrier protein|nr:sulfur carrier protein ThiS [Chthoniobacterales bacterium]